MSGQEKRRVAAIDVGSNSVRLLVANIENGEVNPLMWDKRSTRLLAGMVDGLIADDAIERTAYAVCELAQRARDEGAEDIRAFGTSAMRDGQNRDVLIRTVGEREIPLAVMSGEEEARLAYSGAAPEGRVGVLDIGGGSTEWMAGEDGAIKCALSVQMGAVRLFEQMRGNESPRLLIERAKTVMIPAAQRIKDIPIDGWIGTGGSVTTLAAMLLQLEPYDPLAVHGFVIRAEAAKSWLDMLWAMPVALRGQLKGLEVARVDIIPCGIAILLAFFDLSGVREIKVSTKDNLEGFIRTHMM